MNFIDNKLINQMREYCIKKHNMPSDCQRYGNEPYSKHLEDVVNNVIKYIYYIAPEKHITVKCAGWGHDLLEDTDTSPSDLAKIYGLEITDIIFRVTNERAFDRKSRNFKTYPKIWENDLAIYIKLADRLANTFNSKNSSDEIGKRMYKVYRKEYPIFRYALKVRNLYPDMWRDLDELNEYSIFNEIGD